MEHTILILFTLLVVIGFPVIFLSGLFGFLYIALLTVLLSFATAIPVPEVVFLTLGILAVVALAIDVFSGVLGARLGGAKTKALWFGLLGTIIGTVLIPFPLVGSIIGLFGGIVFGEIRAGQSRKKAVKAATGGVVGTLVGGTLNIVLAVAFLIYFLVTIW
jgi:uncharacterized protein